MNQLPSRSHPFKAVTITVNHRPYTYISWYSIITRARRGRELPEYLLWFTSFITCCKQTSLHDQLLSTSIVSAQLYPLLVDQGLQRKQSSSHHEFTLALSTLCTHDYEYIAGIDSLYLPRRWDSGSASMASRFNTHKLTAHCLGCQLIHTTSY